jgi:hypothetical protein
VDLRDGAHVRALRPSHRGSSLLPNMTAVSIDTIGWHSLRMRHIDTVYNSLDKARQSLHGRRHEKGREQALRARQDRNCSRLEADALRRRSLLLSRPGAPASCTEAHTVHDMKSFKQW